MTQASPANQRLIALPIGKAVEIAWKSIRLRLSRSMLVTSAILLALAFLCSILTTQTLLDGLRGWTERWPGSSEFKSLKQQREQTEIELQSIVSVLRYDADAAPAAGARKFDPKISLGDDWDAIRRRAGSLPVASSDLNRLLTARPELLDDVKRMIALCARDKQLRQQLNQAEELKAVMASHGVPTDPADIAANRVQTRWVIGLALLVAFVGILNAMLMSVTERFREIGTMKCLGALDSFIVKLFLLESLFQGTVGTLAGIVVGLAVSFGLSLFTYGSATFNAVPWGTVSMNVAITLLVGVALSVGGAILPALQAARMEPIAAMRVEA